MFICDCCKRTVDEDPYWIFEEFLSYIREEHDDYDTTYIDPGLCLSCAIDAYEEPRYGSEWHPEHDEPVIFDPEEPDPYDSD